MLSTTTSQNAGQGVREITLGQAIREALAEEMRRDPRVFMMGEDIAEAGTPFKVLSGLVEEFGTSRVIDTPISEAGITGMGVGVAMTGMRPIVDIMFGDFIGLAMDQIVNQAAKVHYMSGGKLKVPLVVRTTLGATRRTAAQHSQSLHAWVSHIPGLIVVLPSTPYDAKGLLATSSMVQIALAAADGLEKLDISAEVIDPRTMYPLDRDTLIESAKKTSRVIVVDEGYERYGVTAEIAAVVADGAFYFLDAPVKRMGAMNVPVPFSPALEDLTVPTADSVMEVSKTLCGRV
ncbi:MAG: alpha-ketoacid dehydrogenase subunit beta [Chloroflexi bacterium]|nr:MAG: alpha-ketoacid dehydrogenase subunit beta [Chloroflexota bacterium]